ncbi:hypothetical protein BaRGS_00023432, partial [Batillaria attramentaria]
RADPSLVHSPQLVPNTANPTPFSLPVACATAALVVVYSAVPEAVGEKNKEPLTVHTSITSQSSSLPHHTQGYLPVVDSVLLSSRRREISGEVTSKKPGKCLDNATTARFRTRTRQRRVKQSARQLTFYTDLPLIFHPWSENNSLKGCSHVCPPTPAEPHHPHATFPGSSRYGGNSVVAYRRVVRLIKILSGVKRG